MSFGVGKDVISYCSKCKLSLSHIIVSMKDSVTIAKVKCNTCKTIHVYKDPAKATKKTRRDSGRTKSKSRSKSIPVAEIWMEAINNSEAKSQKYSISTKYKVKDIIDHPKFGPGVVDELIDENKINVIFRHEVKTLMHNKAA